MAKTTTVSYTETKMLCNTLDDLLAAINSDASQVDGVELSIELTIPGIGKHRIYLLDDVPITCIWKTEE